MTFAADLNANKPARICCATFRSAPLPLYSTLIILCGFAFGLWQGFIISYIAALSGAITVFLLSRSLLKDWMVNLLNKSGGLKKVSRLVALQESLLSCLLTLLHLF